MSFFFLPFIIILLLWLRYQYKKDSDRSVKIHEDFWTKERDANFTRKQDIDHLEYLIIPMDHLPFVDSDNSEIIKYQKIFTDLASKRILNLGGISNTEIKMQYGSANLPLLSEYDVNFSNLLRNIVSLATCLLKNGYESEAVTFLEYGIECGSDITNNYTLLAEYYNTHNEFNKIEFLKEKAASLNSIKKASITDKLELFSKL